MARGVRCIIFCAIAVYAGVVTLLAARLRGNEAPSDRRRVSTGALRDRTLRGAPPAAPAAPPAAPPAEAAVPAAQDGFASESEFEVVDLADCAFVTLVCDDESLVPAATLFASLQLARTEAQVVALVTPDVSAQGLAALHSAGALTYAAAHVETPFERRQGALSKRLRKGCIYTKLRAWELTRFKRIVLLDSDILVTANLDTLFQRRRLSAVADAYPRIFNAGLIVLTPEKELAERLVGAASAYRSYDQGDQGFLNAYFQDHPTDALPKSDSAQGAVDGQGWVDGQGGVAWGQLDPKYNLPISTLNSRFGKPYQKHVTRKEEAIGSPASEALAVLHFSGELKPWRLLGAISDVAGRRPDAVSAFWDKHYEPRAFLRWHRLADAVAEQLGCAARRVYLPYRPENPRAAGAAERGENGRVVFSTEAPRNGSAVGSIPGESADVSAVYCGVEACPNGTRDACRPETCELHADLFSSRRFDTVTDQLTVVLSTFRGGRVPISSLVDHYLNSTFVSRVVVIWHDPKTPPPERPPPKRVSKNGKLVTTLWMRRDSPNNRFLPFDVGTRHVLVCDDDILVSLDDLAFAFTVANENPTKLVSPFVRAHEMMNSKSVQGGARRYSLALTKFMLAPSWLLFVYGCVLDPSVHAYVDAVRNCDDVAFNLAQSRVEEPERVAFSARTLTKVAAATGSGAPLMVDVAVQDLGESKAGGGLSKKRNHIYDRFRCSSDLERLLRNDGRFDRTAPSPLKAASTAASRFISARVEFKNLQDALEEMATQPETSLTDAPRVVLQRDSTVGVDVINDATVDARKPAGAEARALAEGDRLSLRGASAPDPRALVKKKVVHFNNNYVEVHLPRKKTLDKRDVLLAPAASGWPSESDDPPAFSERRTYGMIGALKGLDVIRNEAFVLLKIRKRDLKRLDSLNERRGVVLMDLALSSATQSGATSPLFDVDGLGAPVGDSTSGEGLAAAKCPLAVFYCPKIPEDWTDMSWATLMQLELDRGSGGFFYPLTNMNSLVMLDISALDQAYSRARGTRQTPSNLTLALFVADTTAQCHFSSTKGPARPQFELVKFRKPVT